MVVIIVIAALNIRGVRESASVENVAPFAKVGALVAISVALLLLGHGTFASATLPPSTTAPTSLVTALGAAMIGVLWAYEGWQYVTFSAGETRDPQRVFPRGIAIATAALVVLYLLANLAYVAALGTAAAAASDHVAADAMRSVFGPLSGKFFSALVLVSIFSAMNGLMSRRRACTTRWPATGSSSSAWRVIRFGTPVLAIVLLTAAAGGAGG